MAIRTDAASPDATDERESAELHSTRTEREEETVDAGALIWDVEYEKRRTGWTSTERQLVGLKVDDYDGMRSELIRRGLSTGALHHKAIEGEV
jgi:hypothetical protein